MHLEANGAGGLAAVGGLIEGQAAEAHGLIDPAGGPEDFPAVFHEGQVRAEFLGAAPRFVIGNLELIQAHLEIKGLLYPGLHLKSVGHLPLVYGQLAVHPPEFADEAARQDQQEGHMDQVRAQGAKAAPFQEIDVLVRKGLPAAAAQFPAEGGGYQRMGINPRRPGNLAPFRQGEGGLSGERLEDASHGPGQAVDHAGQDIHRQQADGPQKPGAEIDAGKTAPPEQCAPDFAETAEVLVRGLALGHHGADDRHRGQNQEEKDRQADGGQRPPQP